MTVENEPLGILLVGHGSPRAETNQRFIALAGRIAARLGMENVLPTFFSIARPDIPDRVTELAARGVRRIVLMPYFLYAGQHVTHDIPALLAECGRRFPDVAMEVLPALEDDPAIEDAVVERLTAIAARPAAMPTIGDQIERRSYQIIDGQLGPAGPADASARCIVRRIIHATADFSFARSLRIHPQAVACGRAALAAGRPIICDVKMLQAGITKPAAEVLCAIDRPEVAAAGPAGAMYSCGGGDGNAAAAAGGGHCGRRQRAPRRCGRCWKSPAAAGRGRPWSWGCRWDWSARESKLALLESDLCYITNTGSAVAARWRPRPSMPWLCQREISCDEKMCDSNNQGPHRPCRRDIGSGRLVARPAQAMHIHEGGLPASWAGLWFLLAAPFLWWGLNTINCRRAQDPSYMLMVAMVGAAIFVISCMPVPVPVANSCSHPCGTGLGALLIGPGPTVVVASIALLLQALFLSHGGLTTLGANIMSMGVVGAMSAYLLYHLLRRMRVPLMPAAFLAGMVSDWATYAMTSLELSSAWHLDRPMWAMFVATALLFIPTQLPLGLAEGVVTAIAYRFVLVRRPELLGLQSPAGAIAGEKA